MKQNLRLFMLTLLCAVFSIPLEAQTTYTKVTSTDDITDGDYLIVYEGNATHEAVAFDGSLSTLDVASNGIAVDIEDGTIEFETAPNFYFTIDTTNGTIKSASGLYIGVTANSNGLKQSEKSSDYKNSFSIEAGVAVIKSEAGPTLRYNYASDQLRFRFYKTGQQDIQLYKKDTPANKVADPTFSPVDGTTFTESLKVSISCTTTGATIYYTTNGDTPTTNSTAYSAPFNITKTTTVKAIAVANGMTNSSVVAATYTKEEVLTLLTIAEARTQATGEVATKGVITSLNGNNAYIQDATAAIYIYGSCGSFSIGDEIIVKGTLSNYKGLLEITPTSCTRESSNNTVTPEVMTIAQVNASTNQGWLIKIEDATVQSISGQDVTIAQGTNTVLVRFNKTSDITFAVNDIIKLTGNIGCFNTVQIANPTIIEVQENEEGLITVSNTSVNVTADGGDGIIEVTYTNIGTPQLNYFDANGEPAEYDWIVADIDNDDWNIEYVVEENTGEERTAYIQIFGYGPNDTEVYSEMITITQAAYVAPAESKTYQKVTSTKDITDGNYLIVYEGNDTHAAVAFNGSLGALDVSSNIVPVEIDDDVIEDNNDAYFTIDVTNGSIKSASGIYIGVESNANGLKTSTTSDYTNTFEIDGSGYAVIASDQGPTMRYNYASDQQRFRFYKTGQQPIALYKEVDEIVKEPSIEVNPIGINVDAEGGSGTITVTYKNFEETEIEADIAFYAADGETSSTYDWVTASINSNNNLAYTVAANSGEARTAYLKVYAMDGNGDNFYSDLITINQAAFVVDYATIPFEFNGGRADIENTDGLTQSGLDSDYSTDNTKLKFNTTGDWLLLKLEEHSETALSLSFDIKGNPASGNTLTTGTFSVQVSADNETYTDLTTYNELSDTQTEIFDLAEDVRYIKWIYTTKSSGNVGLGNIVVIAPEEIVVTFNKRAEGYSTLYYGTKNLIIPNGVKASTYKVGDDGKYVETEYESIIPKGSAVVIELEDKSLIANGNKDVTFTTTAATETAHTDNMLYGFDEDDQWTVGPDETKEYLFYSLSLNAARDEGSIGFYWNNKDGNDNGGQFKIPAHRAYLAVEKETANGVSAFAFDGIGTGINGIFANGLPTDGVFTLTGVRVNSDSLQKGIYIVNGKKVVIK